MSQVFVVVEYLRGGTYEIRNVHDTLDRANKVCDLLNAYGSRLGYGVIPCTLNTHTKEDKE